MNNIQPGFKNLKGKFKFSTGIVIAIEIQTCITGLLYVIYTVFPFLALEMLY